MLATRIEALVHGSLEAGLIALGAGINAGLHVVHIHRFLLDIKGHLTLMIRLIWEMPDFDDIPAPTLILCGSTHSVLLPSGM